MNTVAKAHLFAVVFTQRSIVTADCLHHTVQMTGIDTVWELHTPNVINSCYNQAIHSGIHSQDHMCQTSGSTGHTTWVHIHWGKP